MIREEGKKKERAVASEAPSPPDNKHFPSCRQQRWRLWTGWLEMSWARCVSFRSLVSCALTDVCATSMCLWSAGVARCQPNRNGTVRERERERERTDRRLPAKDAMMKRHNIVSWSRAGGSSCVVGFLRSNISIGANAGAVCLAAAS